MPNSLILEKINYATEKKLEIASQVGITSGNPTWNQIKSAITSMKNSYETDDAAHKLAISEDLKIRWENGVLNMPDFNQTNFIDSIFYFVGRTFCTCQNNKFKEFIDGSWTLKTWGNKSPNPRGGNVDIWEDNGVLHYKDTSVYDPEIDDWVEETGITDYHTLSDYRCFWHDNDGNTHYDNTSKHYVYDRDTKTWSDVTWNVTIDKGEYIWTDGTNVYYSNGTNQYVLSADNETWVEKDWSSNASNQLTSFYGTRIFELPKYSVFTTNQDKVLFCLESGNFYKYNGNSVWTKYKFANALPTNYTNVWFWYCKESSGFEYITLTTKYESTTTHRTWMQIPNNWTAIETAKAATLDYLMNN